MDKIRGRTLARSVTVLSLTALALACVNKTGGSGSGTSSGGGGSGSGSSSGGGSGSSSGGGSGSSSGTDSGNGSSGGSVITGCGGISTVQWVTTSGTCTGGASTPVTLTLTLTIDNPTTSPITVESVSGTWANSPAAPSPTNCGVSSSAAWTLSSMTIPASSPNATLTLQSTQTCSGWGTDTTGDCDLLLNVNMVTSCGTMQGISEGAIVLDIQQ